MLLLTAHMIFKRTSLSLSKSLIGIATLALLFRYRCHVKPDVLHHSLCSHVQLDYSNCKYRHHSLYFLPVHPLKLLRIIRSILQKHVAATRIDPCPCWFGSTQTPPMQAYILSSHRMLPRHREQQPHQPPRSYVIIFDPVVASDHGMTSLLPLISPPCTTVCSPSKWTVRQPY